MRARRLTPSANLVNDLVALHFPVMAARRAAMRVKALASAVDDGRITLAEARAQLRGEA